MPEDTNPTEVSAEELRRWNRLIAHSKKKGYAGKPELDHDDKLRRKVFDEFNRENPSDAISIDRVRDIQNEIQKYKKQSLENIKSGKAIFSGKPEDFMKDISQVDNIFGQKTSQFAFPEAYLVEKGQKKKLGFANKVDITALNSAKSVEDFYKK